MKLFLVILACLVALATAGEDILPFYHTNEGIPLATRIKQSEQAVDFDGARIVGGSVAKLGAHPYMAGLLIDLTGGQQSACGSSLLSQTRLLTAAHCWFDGSNQALQVTVVLGSIFLFSGGTRVVTNDVTIHEDYNPRNLNNNIAIIKINRINYSNFISNIDLPTAFHLNNNFAGYTAQAVGFGAISDWSNISIILNRATLQVITNELCSLFYLPGIVGPSTLCTNNNWGTSTCRGDSGGPLSITHNGRPVLIGVASFSSALGCTSAPAGFARVTSFLDWIQARL